eukprot:COSAG05_NODE_1000_length_6247_cov_23.555628_8_plen_92_part_00
MYTGWYFFSGFRSLHEIELLAAVDNENESEDHVPCTSQRNLLLDGPTLLPGLFHACSLSPYLLRPCKLNALSYNYLEFHTLWGRWVWVKIS